MRESCEVGSDGGRAEKVRRGASVRPVEQKVEEEEDDTRAATRVVSERTISLLLWWRLNRFVQDAW
jgi:hypothetical protein